jgi:hypothetical protein
VQTLLSSQRSLSESNLFSGLPGGEQESQEDDYVDMSHYNRECWGQQQMYVNYSDLHEGGGFQDSPPESPPPAALGVGVTLRRRGMQRQASSSVGDLRAAVDAPQPLYENARACTGLFRETEELYENGQHVMEYFMYGHVEGERPAGRGVVTALCGDSGLGSTPSSSPLLAHHQQRSFSLDDVRQAGTLARQRPDDTRQPDPSGETCAPLHTPLLYLTS